MLYISIQRFYVTSTQNSINGTLRVYSIYKIKETEIKMKNTTNNISSLRNGLNSFIKRTTANEIVIKPADNGPIITVMSPEFYWNICELH